jgi:hypothetical protein
MNKNTGTSFHRQETWSLSFLSVNPIVPIALIGDQLALPFES